MGKVKDQATHKFNNKVAALGEKTPNNYAKILDEQAEIIWDKHRIQELGIGKSTCQILLDMKEQVEGAHTLEGIDPRVAEDTARDAFGYRDSQVKLMLRQALRYEAEQSKGGGRL